MGRQAWLTAPARLMHSYHSYRKGARRHEATDAKARTHVTRCGAPFLCCVYHVVRRFCGWNAPGEEPEDLPGDALLRRLPGGEGCGEGEGVAVEAHPEEELLSSSYVA